VLFSGLCYSQTPVKGVVLETDSITAMPFVFVINKSTGNGTVSDNEGRFYISVSDQDTLLFSFVGYAKTSIPVSHIKKGDNGILKVYLNRMPINLNTVNVTSFKIKPYEREYMKDIINRSQMSTISAFNSPFSALYMQYSKEGRQVRKLAQIFEELMVEEQVQQKLSPEILRRLTGDNELDYAVFRKYCFQLSNDYIISHDGFELYTKVMDCYRRWKSERR
jgi:hypothetical protein